MKLLTAVFFVLLLVVGISAQTSGPSISLAPTTTAVRDPTTNNWKLITQEKRAGASTVALAGAGAGNVDNGTHRIKVEFVTSAGHTDPGTQSLVVTVVDKSTNGKVAISGIPTGSIFVTSRKVYMNTVAAPTIFRLLSNGTIADNTTTTLTANDSDATLGAAAIIPAGNTTANPVLGYTGSTGAVTVAGVVPSATPAGSDTQVQFNSGGSAFGGSANLTWTSPQLLVQSLTTTSPGFYSQITGDTVPRVRVGLNATDVASLGLGGGSGARDLFLERAGAANLRLGAPAVDTAPVAQTLSVQNTLAGGTSDVAGANWTFAASQGKGTGAGGSIIFQVAPAGSTGTTVNSLATALTIDSAKLATFAGNIAGVNATFVATPTTGNGLAVSSSTVTSGNVVSIAATGTVAASSTKTALNVATSGANGTSAQVTFGAQFSNTSSGTTSKNVAASFVATGGASSNTPAIFGVSTTIGAGSNSAWFDAIGGAYTRLWMDRSSVNSVYAPDSMILASSFQIGFNSTNTPFTTGAQDTTITRQGAGVVQFGTTTNNALGSILAAAATFSGALLNTGITSDATHTDSSVCQDTTTHQFYAGSGAAGICLGTSSVRFKNSINNLGDGLQQVLGLRPRSFFYNPGYGDNGGHLQYGFIAEEMIKNLPQLVRPDIHGLPQSIDYMGLVPVLTKAIQELNAKLEAQQKEINALKAKDN